MKKWLSVIAAVVLSLALVVGIACGGGEEEESGVKKLKWGAGLAMKGAYGAVMGIPVTYVFELTAEKIGEFEVAGERYVWDITIEENELTIAGGAASTNKLIYDHHVDFIFQAGSDPALAAAMITEELGMILDIGGGGPDCFGLDKPHTFSATPVWLEGAAPFFDWLTKEHPEVKTVAGSATQTFVGMDMFNAVKYACEHYGLEVHAVISPETVVEYYPIAAKLMTFDPDLVYGGLPLFKAMWDMGYDGLCVADHWVEAASGTVPWDKAAGKVLFYMPGKYGPWPEVIALAEEYEDRYGVELTPSTTWALNILYIMTEVLKQAGTVDDVDKIIETMETGTFNSLVGPVHYGLEELIGIPHIAVWPSPIYKVMGEGEYEIIKVYSPEEVETLVNEIYGEKY